MNCLLASVVAAKKVPAARVAHATDAVLAASPSRSAAASLTSSRASTCSGIRYRLRSASTRHCWEA